MLEQETPREPSVEKTIARRKPENEAPFSTALTWGVAFCVYGLVLVSAQCLFWLQSDAWISISTYDLLVGHPLDVPSNANPLLAEIMTKRVPLPVRLIPSWSAVDGGDPGWLVAPHSWYGLHTVVATILQLLPLSLLSFAIGILIARFATRHG